MDVKGLLKSTTSEISSISTEVKELSKIHTELFKVELEECGDYVKKKVVAGVVAGLMAFLMTCVFLAALISALGILLRSYLPEGLQPFSWHIVASFFSFIFLLIIFTCVKTLKRKPEASFFSLSKQELQNNREWLQNIYKKKNKTS